MELQLREEKGGGYEVLVGRQEVEAPSGAILPRISNLAPRTYYLVLLAVVVYPPL